MKFSIRYALLVLVFVMAFALAACGEETPATTDDNVGADGHIHDYATRVVEPTCSEGGFTVYTCNICGNKYTDNKVPKTGVCEYETRRVLPSEKTSAFGIDAAWFEAELCRFCGKGEYHTAVLAELTFDGEPEAPVDYVPSANYEAAVASLPDCLVASKLEGEAATKQEENWRKMLDFIDQQKYLDVWGGQSGVRGASIVDGALVGDWQFFVADNMNLFSEQPAYEQFSISFDLTVNGNLKKGSANDYAAIFGAGGGSTDGGSNSMWRNPWRLCLNSTPRADGAYELVCAYWTYGSGGTSTRYITSTNTYIEKGKTYSYRLDFGYDEPNGEYPTFRLYIKEAGVEEYIDLGTYSYIPRPDSSSFKFFDPNCAGGNVLDNFKIFIDLED